MPGTRGKYGRVLLKLSGEVFGGEKGIGVDPDVVQDVAKQIPEVSLLSYAETVECFDGGSCLIENERRIAEETAREEGKPEASLSKIIEGRVTGFVKEVSLIEQAFAKDAKKTVKQILDEAGTAVKAFHRFRVGQ